MANKQIEEVEEYKYLRTTINKKLTFHTNPNNITEKSQKRLFIIKQLAFLKVKPSAIS